MASLSGEKTLTGPSDDDQQLESWHALRVESRNPVPSSGESGAN
jgi:hypothetical protein